MLLRAADHLFWMGRYLERVENTARVLETTCEASLLPKGRRSADREWEGLLVMVGRRDDFLARYGAPSAAKVLRFMIVDLDNPSSLLASLRAARENARSVCGAIPPEVWESINGLWLDLKEIDETGLLSEGEASFLDRVQEGTDLFRGIVHSTLSRDDVYRPIDLGTFLERADHTVRTLGARFPGLLQNGESVENHDAWSAILRSVGAAAAYRRLHRDLIVPERVAELLILREELPCSLHACLDRINDLLSPFSRGIGPEAVRLAADLHFLLHDLRLRQKLKHTLHEYLTDFARALQRLGAEIDRGLRGEVCA
ncbi:MAG TPA: alpha-E domain-containing protein [Candidatus Manganitrophaceae bacterium]|nr:alpha-E domain-containing protein [Candidatus Manganitrophaceae bacterium]